MNRRDILKNTSLVLGGALSVGTISAVMSGCKAEAIDLGWVPDLLSSEQAQLIGEIAERIIPKTDTPGAKDAGVAKFIDRAINLNITGAKRDALLSGLNVFNTLAKEKFSNSFVAIEDSQKDEIIKSLAEEKSDDGKTIFQTLKELTVAGFFTSEVGAKSALAYDPIPGEYVGCIDYKEVGKAYAI